MKKTMNSLKLQHGVMLLEALISILIFSIGILAIVALQANSIKLASDSTYRSDANLLANQLIGQMWAAPSRLAIDDTSFIQEFSPGSTTYDNWVSSVAAKLPITGVSAPTVTITRASILAASTVSSTVDIDIWWTVPGGTPGNSGAHRYNTRAQITNN